MAGAKINADLALKLIDRLPNFAGVVDASLDWQFMIDAHDRRGTRAPDFLLLSGTELMVSAAAIGASGMFSALAAIAPKLVRQLFDLCRAQKTVRGPRAAGGDRGAAPTRQAGRRRRAQGAPPRMGRDCGKPRPPLLPLDAAAEKKLAAEIEALPSLAAEPRGW